MKKTLIKIGSVIFVFLLLCTFLSRTIETMRIPKVEVIESKSGVLISTVKTKGNIHFNNKQIVSFDIPLNVTKINVSYGQKVNVGDVIFEIDNKEIDLAHRQKLLAVSRAELNAYGENNGNREQINILAQELKIAKDDLEIFEDSNAYYIDYPVEHPNIALAYEQKKLSVNRAEQALNNAKQSAIDSNINNEKIRDIARQELEYAQNDLELFESKYPIDGVVTAQVSGNVTFINEQQNNFINPNEVIAEITDTNSGRYVEFILSKSELNQVSYGDLNIIYETIITEKDKISTNVITEKNALNTGKFDSQKEIYLFKIPLNTHMPENITVTEGAEANISITKSSDEYRFIIPLSAVIKDSPAMGSIYILKSRDGIFGKEDYAVKVDVEIEDENSTSIAIKNEILRSDTKIVVSWDGFLQSGGTVRVKK